MISSCVVGRGSSPLSGPRASPASRSATCSNSASSELTIRIAAPPTRQPVHLLEHFLFGAHVDAARRLVEQKNARVAEQPFRDDDLLLIASAQTAGELARAGTANAQPLDGSRSSRAISALMSRMPMLADAPQIGHRDVVRRWAASAPGPAVWRSSGLSAMPAATACRGF